MFAKESTWNYLFFTLLLNVACFKESNLFSLINFKEIKNQ